MKYGESVRSRDLPSILDKNDKELFPTNGGLIFDKSAEESSEDETTKFVKGYFGKSN